MRVPSYSRTKNAGRISITKLALTLPKITNTIPSLLTKDLMRVYEHTIVFTYDRLWTAPPWVDKEMQAFFKALDQQTNKGELPQLVNGAAHWAMSQFTESGHLLHDANGYAWWHGIHNALIVYPPKTFDLKTSETRRQRA